VDTILAFDIGTSSSRAVLYDAQSGEALPGAGYSIRHEPDVTPDGGSTLDADALVDEALVCARTVLRDDLPAGATVVGVAVCTFWHSLVGVDANGRARTPMLLWSDRRSAPQVDALRNALDPAAYAERTGCPLHTSYLPGRLRWLAETEPDTFAACVRFVSPGEYLFAKLFGAERVTCSVSMASATGLMDQAAGDWDAAQTLPCLPGMTRERLSPIGDAPLSV
jgi:gluconokinase